MALITAESGTQPSTETSLRIFAEDGRLWAERQGFPPIRDEALLIEIGYAVVMIGEHQPDLVISLCERLGLPYKVTTKKITKSGFTYERRTVKPQPDPEPAVLAETPPAPFAKREWGKGRDVKLDIRISESERDEISEAAKERGVSRAAYIRDTLWRAINGDRAQRAEPVDPEWLAEMAKKFERVRWRDSLPRRRRGQ
jgi:hypothetical protein